MRATINSVNVEFSKEENITLLIEINQITKANPAAEGIEKYPMLKKLETILNENYKVGEIASQSTTFNLKARQ